MTGFRSNASSSSPSSRASRETARSVDHGLDVGRRAAAPPVEQRPDPSAGRASAARPSRDSGGSATARSASSSTSTPPAATTTIGPSAGRARARPTARPRARRSVHGGRRDPSRRRGRRTPPRRCRRRQAEHDPADLGPVLDVGFAVLRTPGEPSSRPRRPEPRSRGGDASAGIGSRSARSSSLASATGERALVDRAGRAGRGSSRCRKASRPLRIPSRTGIPAARSRSAACLVDRRREAGQHGDRPGSRQRRRARRRGTTCRRRTPPPGRPPVQ